jgi:capsular polysaccharide biosynthesis protein/GGDEF domain-containing protein
VELRRYLRVLRRHWRLAVIAFLVTGDTTLVLVLQQPDVYHATGTALIRPRMAGTDSDAIDASDLLVRGVTIAETYATVARGDMIRDRADASLDPRIDPSGVIVGAEVVTDTNILSISARGTDPEAVHAVSEAVLDATITYARSLNDAYLLSPLDEPTLPTSPVGPNKGLTIAIGVIFGMLLALVLALFAEYLSGGLDGDDPLTDPRTGLHNEGYLRRRVGEEMSRADRSGRGVVLVGFRVTMRHTGDGEPWRTPADRDLRRIGELLQLTVPEEVVLAHLGNGEFGAILLDIDGPVADRMVAHWEGGLLAVLYALGDRADAVPHLTKGLCAYRDQRFVGDREAKLTAQSLSDHGSSTHEAATAIEVHHAAPDQTGNGSRPAAEAEDTSDHGTVPRARSALGSQPGGDRGPEASRRKRRAARQKR